MKQNNIFNPKENIWDIGWPCSPRKFVLAMILICSVILLLTSCKEHKPHYEFKKKVLFEKTISLYQGTTVYNFAYTDGRSEEVSYGLYATTKPKDTLYFIRDIDYILGQWRVIDKEPFYQYYNDSNLHK